MTAGILVTAAPLRADGSPRLASVALAYPIASVDGLFFDQDRVAVTQGRMANPAKPDEIMMTPLAARQLGFHVGETIPYGIYSQAQQSEPGIGTPRVPPTIRFNAKLVGLATLSSEIVEDDIDRVPTFIIMTPALAREVFAYPKQSFSGAETFGIQTVHGNQDVPRVESELAHVVPPDVVTTFHATAPVEAKADRAIKPIAIALGVFGGVALLAALLIAGQAISRRLRAGADDVRVLRSLGADPLTAAADGLIGVLGAIVIGTLLAVGVAVALSPLAPLGPVRAVYPARGISADWTVLGLGVVVLIGVLGATALIVTFRNLPHRVLRRAQLAPPTTSKVAQAGAAAGLPVSGVVGVRMALEPGGGRSGVPVRSALLGTALAVVLAVATVVFGSSLRTLVNDTGSLRMELDVHVEPGRIGGWQRSPSGLCPPGPGPGRGRLLPASRTATPKSMGRTSRSSSARRMPPSRRRCSRVTPSRRRTRSCSVPPRWHSSTSGWATRSPSPTAAPRTRRSMCRRRNW